jgi:hypothetical protein
MGRHPDSIALAREFGATDIVSERGEEAIARVRDLTGGIGVHSVLECVGTDQAMATAVGMARAGGAIGRVGVPHYETVPSAQPLFYKNIIVGGGPAPVRAYIEDLRPTSWKVAAIRAACCRIVFFPILRQRHPCLDAE